MGSNIIVCKDYIVRPFTIDSIETKIREDGYSISIEEGGIPSFNIHISAIGLEYLLKDCSKQQFKKEKRETNIRKYIGQKNILEYSLGLGERRVLTLKILRDKSNKILFALLCESVEICNNYTYEQVIGNEGDFLLVANSLFCDFFFKDNNQLVSYFASFYSRVMSEYLKNQRVKFFLPTAANGKETTTINGNFTSPIRRFDAFNNQIILLKFMRSILGKSYNELILKRVASSSVEDKPKSLYLG